MSKLSRVTTAKLSNSIKKLKTTKVSKLPTKQNTVKQDKLIIITLLGLSNVLSINLIVTKLI